MKINLHIKLHLETGSECYSHRFTWNWYGNCEKTTRTTVRVVNHRTKLVVETNLKVSSPEFIKLPTNAISSQFWWYRWGWKFPIFGIDIMEKLPIDRNLDVLIDLLQMIVWILMGFMEFHHQKKVQMCWMYVIKLIDFDVWSSRLRCFLNVFDVECCWNLRDSYSSALSMIEWCLISLYSCWLWNLMFWLCHYHVERVIISWGPEVCTFFMHFFQMLCTFLCYLKWLKMKEFQQNSTFSSKNVISICK